MAAMYFSQTLLVFWLSKNGFGFSDIIIFYLISYVVALVSIFLFSRIKIKLKESIFFGVLLSILSVVILMKISNISQLYISGILTGLNVIFFWIPYNIMHFRYSSENRRGLNSGIYFLITPIIGITLQPIAGIVAEQFGFIAMFLIGTTLYILPIFLILFLPDFEWSLDVRKEFKENKFNWSIFFQGFSSRVNYSLIPLFTLFFIHTPRAFGNFFGFLAIVAAIASLINAYISDRLKSRKVFFYIFSSVVVISFLPLAFITKSYLWGVFAGITSLCISLVNPFWLTYSLDNYKQIGVEKTMIIREVFLNSGYCIAFLIALSVFYFTSSTKMSLLIVSFTACLLPIVSYYQGVYSDKIN